MQIRSQFRVSMRNKHDLFIEVTHCFVKWWTGPSSTIGSGTLYSIGVGLPSGQIYPFNPKTFFNGSKSLLFCTGANRKRSLWLIFVSNIDSGAAVRIKCYLNANEFSLQECQILCELRSDLVICCPVKWFLSPIVSSNDEGVQAVKMGSPDLEW